MPKSLNTMVAKLAMISSYAHLLMPILTFYSIPQVLRGYEARVSGIHKVYYFCTIWSISM